MHAPVIFLTNAHKHAIRTSLGLKRAGEPDSKRFLRIIIDAYDILRVEELKCEESGVEKCRITYALDEVPDGAEDERSVQYVVVLHTLDEVWDMMQKAKIERPEWE